MFRTTIPAVLALALLPLSAGAAPAAEATQAGQPQPNPHFIACGPVAYNRLFGQVLDAVDDFFEVAYSNRYDGRVETYPAAVPFRWAGIGYAELYQRGLARLLPTRYRAVTAIRAADEGGFWVDVRVFRERRQGWGGLLGGEVKWCPDGRDAGLEQAILRRVAERDRP
jgi:hypothetical protein